MNRRNFIRSSAAAGTLAAAPNILRAQGAAEKVNVAAIGALGKGRSDWGAIQGMANVVALVDADIERAKKAREEHQKKENAGPAPEIFQDYREMFEKLGDKIDACTVSTPDHTHFPAAMTAVAAGKHVCVQKPMCNTIWECRELHKAATSKEVVTQMGNQGRTMEGQRLVKEWIEQGAIGKLKEIKLWTNRPIWPQGNQVNYQPTDPPASLDWEIWQSIAKHREYSNDIAPFKWRGWWDYGSGALGDMGCHIMDATFSILGQAIPSKIEVESSPVSDTVAPLWSSLVYHFDDSAHGKIKVSWQDGKLITGAPNKPRIPEHLAGDPTSVSAFRKASSGMLFIGETATIFEGDAYASRPYIYPSEKLAEAKAKMASGEIKKTEERSTHPGEPQKEWIHAIENDLPTSSQFDYSAPLTEFVLLGNLAIRAGKTVSWDKAKMSTGDTEADAFIKRAEYVDGWY